MGRSVDRIGDSGMLPILLLPLLVIGCVLRPGGEHRGKATSAGAADPVAFPSELRGLSSRARVLSWINADEEQCRFNQKSGVSSAVGWLKTTERNLRDGNTEHWAERQERTSGEGQILNQIARSVVGECLARAHGGVPIGSYANHEQFDVQSSGQDIDLNFQTKEGLLEAEKVLQATFGSQYAYLLDMSLFLNPLRALPCKSRKNQTMVEECVLNTERATLVALHAWFLLNVESGFILNFLRASFALAIDRRGEGFLTSMDRLFLEQLPERNDRELRSLHDRIFPVIQPHESFLPDLT